MVCLSLREIAPDPGESPKVVQAHGRVQTIRGELFPNRQRAEVILLGPKQVTIGDHGSQIVESQRGIEAIWSKLFLNGQCQEMVFLLFLVITAFTRQKTQIIQTVCNKEATWAQLFPDL